MAIQLTVMIEGQEGLTWERWEHILALAERLNFPSVFRSDHYFINAAVQQESLDARARFAARGDSGQRQRE